MHARHLATLKVSFVVCSYNGHQKINFPTPHIDEKNKKQKKNSFCSRAICWHEKKEEN